MQNKQTISHHESQAQALTRNSPYGKSPNRPTRQYPKPLNRIPLRNKVKASTSEINVSNYFNKQQSPQQANHTSALQNGSKYNRYNNKDKQSNVPAEKILQRIKNNLAIIQGKMQLLLQDEDEEPVRAERPKMMQKKDQQGTRVTSIGRSSSRKRLDTKLRTEGPKTQRKNADYGRGTKGGQNWK